MRLHSLSQVLRSLLFNVVMFSTVTVFAPLSLLTWPLPPLARYRFISQWARFHIWLLKALCGLGYRVEGREHLPRDRTAVVLAKHQSSWETLAFQQILPPQVWVLKHELLWVPFFGWGLALLDPIAIDRGAGRKAVQQIIEQGRQRPESGRWVVVFPEGPRMAAGQQGLLQPEARLRGMTWMDILTRDEGHNLLTYAATFTSGFGVEAPMKQPLAMRVEGITQGLLAAINTWETQSF